MELTEHEDFADAYAHLGRFLDEVYQRKRIHSALGYLTPTEFEAAWQARQRSCSRAARRMLPTPIAPTRMPSIDGPSTCWGVTGVARRDDRLPGGLDGGHA